MRYTQDVRTENCLWLKQNSTSEEGAEIYSIKQKIQVQIQL